MEMKKRVNDRTEMKRVDDGTEIIRDGEEGR